MPARRRGVPAAHLRKPELPAGVTRDDARVAGLTDRQIDRRLESGVWAALRRGQLQVVGRQEQLPPAEAQLRAAICSAPGRDLVVSHASAAMLYGLPAPIGGWGPPTLTAASGTARRAGLHVRVASLADAEVQVIRGLPVTSLTRTVLDCLRTLPGRDALAIADAALRAGLSPARLEEQAVAQAGWPGIVVARELLDLADGRRESPLESWSALTFHRGDLPRPTWQVDIRNSIGSFCGRVDSWWPEGLCGEADGKAKYALAAAERGGANMAGLLDALARERGRESMIRRTEAELIRWGARDVLGTAGPEALCRHIREKLKARATSAPFNGTAVPATMRFLATG